MNTKPFKIISGVFVFLICSVYGGFFLTRRFCHSVLKSEETINEYSRTHPELLELILFGTMYNYFDQVEQAEYDHEFNRVFLNNTNREMGEQGEEVGDVGDVGDVGGEEEVEEVGDEQDEQGDDEQNNHQQEHHQDHQENNHQQEHHQDHQENI